MTRPLRGLAPDEVDLRGDWVVHDDRSLVADATEDCWTRRPRASPVLIIPMKAGRLIYDKWFQRSVANA